MSTTYSMGGVLLTPFHIMSVARQSIVASSLIRL